MDPTFYIEVKCHSCGRSFEVWRRAMPQGIDVGAVGRDFISKNADQTCPWCGKRDTYAEADLNYGMVAVDARDFPPTGFRP